MLIDLKKVVCLLCFIISFLTVKSQVGYSEMYSSPNGSAYKVCWCREESWSGPNFLGSRIISELKFVFTEKYKEYDISNLAFKVFNSEDLLIPGITSMYLSALNSNAFGFNQYTLNVGLLKDGYYTLEVKDSKGRVKYLKFRIIRCLIC